MIKALIAGRGNMKGNQYILCTEMYALCIDYILISECVCPVGEFCTLPHGECACGNLKVRDHDGHCEECDPDLSSKYNPDLSSKCSHHLSIKCARDTT